MILSGFIVWDTPIKTEQILWAELILSKLESLFSCSIAFAPTPAKHNIPTGSRNDISDAFV